MLRGSVDLRDDHVVEIRAALFDAFDLDPGEREQLREFFDTRRQLYKFAQPIDGKFHANCRRNRRSFAAK